MTRYMQVGLMVLCVGVSGLGTAAAQPAPPAGGPPQAPPPPRADAPRFPVSLRVEVVIARYRDEKRISSLPYAMTVIAGGERATLRMGAEMPVRMGEAVTYRPVGTNIDASAVLVGEGRVQLVVSVEDSSVYGQEATFTDRLRTEIGAAETPAATPTQPVFRTFRTTNTIVLRDGGSAQFTAATDRVSGEVIRLEVSVRILE